MATSYLAPGVYVEEVPSSMQSIAGTGTNTVGFIGIVEDTIDCPEFLPDDAYQTLLKAAFDKAYGKDDDYSDDTLKTRQQKADKAAADAATAETTLKNKLAQAKTEADKAREKVEGLPADATDATREPLATALAKAVTAQTGLAKDLEKAQADRIAADAEAARNKALTGLSQADRVRQAKLNARQQARTGVPRYKRVSHPVDITPGRAKLCTNFSQFQEYFGDWSAYPDDGIADASSLKPSGHQVLSHAVYGFFLNGGRRCFVARVREATLAADMERALSNFESIEELSIVAFPGRSADRDVSSALVAHCEKTRYRFAILDAQTPVDGNGRLDLQKLTYDGQNQTLPLRTKHAAMYLPCIQVVDPALQTQQAHLESLSSSSKGAIHVPVSGHVSGIYARTDTQRGVFKAPANTGVLGALNVQHYISRNAQEGLNPQGVNCIRTLNGDITVWGARTCGGDDNNEWRYVSVRRTFLYIAKSIDEGTQWVVFEPNDIALWGKVRRNVGAFLTQLWRDGALFGATAEEAFYVKCDAENNPPDSRETGKLVVEVGISIVRPAEFVIFRITQGTGAKAQ